MSQRILIVEDDRINRKLFREILHANGYDTCEAESGQTGLEMASTDHPNLILMDIQLPGMDGLQAVGALKRNPATSAIPVLALTGYAIQGDRERILAGGFDDYLTKPVDIDHLLEAVRKWLPI